MSLTILYSDRVADLAAFGCGAVAVIVDGKMRLTRDASARHEMKELSTNLRISAQIVHRALEFAGANCNPEKLKTAAMFAMLDDKEHESKRNTNFFMTERGLAQ